MRSENNSLFQFSDFFKKGSRFYFFAQKVYSSPALVIITSFMAAILIGAVMLMLPFSLAAGKDSISFVDALFTATSATCVTGLVVVDTGSYFSAFGQAVILVLIQLGGLGIMTFSSFFILSLGRKLSMSQQVVLKDSLDLESLKISKQAVRFIVIYTLILELAGAVALFLCWPKEVGSVFYRMYASVFHSVSAFCNAGFSLFADSFNGYSSNIGLNVVIMILIVVGGIGYFVIEDIKRVLFGKKSVSKKKVKFSIHSKIVIFVTLFLIILGAVGYFMLEKDYSLSGQAPVNKVLISAFQSVTPRTAGFSTYDTASLRKSTLQLIMFLMFIGAAPGSTAGGVKVTVFALLLLSLISKLKGNKEIVIWSRRIPSDLVDRAMILVICGLAVVFAGTLILNAVEDIPFEHIMFEVVSALGTVGLSCGVTAKLSVISRLAIICIMFFGRIGPLVLSVIITKNTKDSKVKYPEERVMLG